MDQDKMKIILPIPKPVPIVTQRKRKGVFTRELKHMMYGFGDVKNPLPESVDLLEDIVTEYITEMTVKATEVAANHSNKLRTEDIVFLVRKDKKKYNRVKDLLSSYEEIKRAKKTIDVND